MDTFDDVQEIGPVTVLQSAAGYYIGQLYRDRESQQWWPYERLSPWYYPTKEAAEAELHLYQD